MPISSEALRHTLATLAYRASKSVRGAPPGFASFRACPTTRTPVEILAHMGDLMDWGLAISREKPVFEESTPRPWDDEVARFFDAITAWDRFLASDAPVMAPGDRLFQGPIADALGHVGQIMMLRRMAGCPLRGESFNRAPIEIGRTGLDQAVTDPRFEFD
jgi:hypothetical protein